MTSGWYLTELIFCIHDSNNPSISHFDKQMRLLKAGSSREAYQNTLVMASRELDKRNAEPKESEQWEFAGIGLLQTIEQPENDSVDNMELHYTIETPGDAKAYLHALRTKNALLQMQIAQTA
jgi:GTP:adenosylcobinamide-phosphate guanylyltransferase